VTLSASVSALRSAVRSYYGVGQTVLYADPRTLIAFSPSDPEYAAYESRLSAVSTRYTYLACPAISGHAANTYAAFVSAFDSLSTGDKAGAIMVNLEDTYWLTILNQPDTSGVNSAWQTAPEIIEEFSRQSVTLNGSTTLDTYRQVAAQLWNDAADYALGQGASDVIHYASVGQSFSDFTGVPRGGIRTYAPASGVSWWTTGSPLMRDSYDTVVSTAALKGLMLGQTNASAHGCSIYCFIPNSSRADAVMSHYASASATRYSAGSIPQATDFDSSDLRHWVRDTARRQLAEYVRACVKTHETLGVSAAGVPSRTDAVLLGCGTPILTGSFINWQHWNGLLMRTADRVAEDEVAALFMAGDVDGPLFRSPRRIWFWHSAQYYFVSLATNTLASSNTVAPTRWSHEVDLFQRPAYTPGEPIGSTSQATQNAWFAANCMGDSWWNSGSAGHWWTVGSGSMLPSPCVLDSTCPLVTGGWLTLDHSITRAEVVTAIKHWVSDTTVGGVEAARTALDAIRR